MMKEAFSIIAVFSLFFTSCLGPTKQQAFLEDLAQRDIEIGKFQFKTGRSGTFAFVDLRSMKNDANPAAAVRAFLLVAEQYKDEPLEGFELRYRGEVRYFFNHSDLAHVIALYSKENGTLSVMSATLSAARAANRSPASVFTPPPQNEAPAAILQAVTQDMQRFLAHWFLTDERQRNLRL